MRNKHNKMAQIKKNQVSQDNKKKVNKYVNAYSLWQKSTAVEKSADVVVPVPSSSEVKDIPPVIGIQIVRDSLNRKIVMRDGLFYAPGQPVYPRHRNLTTNDWVDKFKPKKRKQPCQPQPKETNIIQRNLTKALAQPVEISKGANMLQKMGWQGGALGKTGTGITEPIAPDASYAATTKGLGHSTQTNVTKPLSKKMLKKELAKANEMPPGDKQIFKANILNLILDFVQDDNELELVFETTLLHKERFLIHNLVNSVINVAEDDLEEYWCTEPQMEIVRKIQDRSCFILGTLSHGAKTQRELTIYKQTPPNVYAVIPDDLKYDEDDVIVIPDDPKDDVKGTKSDEAKDNDVIIVEKTREIDNDIIKTETTDDVILVETTEKDLDNDVIIVDKSEGPNDTVTDPSNMDTDKILEDSKTGDELLDKIIGYFSEFIDQDVYTDFRFLGPFATAERAAIFQFMSNLNACTNTASSPRHQRLLDVIKGTHLEIYDDCNGTTVIHKVTEYDGDTVT